MYVCTVRRFVLCVVLDCTVHTHVCVCVCACATGACNVFEGEGARYVGT